MEVKILKKSEPEISFVISGITPGFANSLRRVMMMEIPTMAIEFVDFLKNSSSLQDEIIANRLGQIPLKFESNIYELPSECKCEGKGCSRCQVKFVLKKKGPCMVYSGDLKSKNKDVYPVFDNIPIIELFENEELEFEATAQLGFGKEHAKWQASVASYKNMPAISIDTRKCKGEKCAKCVAKCVRKILKVENGKIIVTDEKSCNLCLQCLEVCPEEAIKVEALEDTFVFNVETTSGLTAEEIVFEAIEALSKKIKEFGKELKKIK
ncbi:MAG: DNA-directed RNA polymerase subunit D [Candidatus Aenigmatarchaeota archaeon]